MTEKFETTEVGDKWQSFAQAEELMTPMRGKGKELCDLLRKELKVPEGVQSFEVRFAHDDLIRVRCDYTPKGLV